MEFAGSMLSPRACACTAKSQNPALAGRTLFGIPPRYVHFYGANKRYNRKSEFLYEKAETTALLANILTGAAYPKAELHDGWETILLNQFHDIIPRLVD